MITNWPTLLIVISMVLAGPTAAYATCFEESAAKYPIINPHTLRLLAKHESGQRLSAINQNQDGTTDYCAMQINSRWLPKLAQFGITPQKLLTDSCLCIDTGAWIFAQQVLKYGNTWQAVGAYHTGSCEAHPVRCRDYAAKVLGQRSVYLDLWP